MPDWNEVIDGSAKWSVEAGDCLERLAELPADSVDLVLTSPPYDKARTYGIGFDKAGQAWADWMVHVTKACLRVCTGAVLIVCQGQTKHFSWSASPVLLMADLIRAGVTLRTPQLYHRIGIPGSGGPDYLRNDWEFVICATRGGKLPWSNPVACGHPPKWAPGGEMSNRLSDGSRVNQWGKTGAEAGVNGKAQRKRNGERQKASRPSHVMRRVTRGAKDGDTQQAESYAPPVLANPGSVWKQTYTAEEAQQLLAQYEEGDAWKCKVGGGLMGNALAAENEAPFPMQLTNPLVQTFCKPGGIVLDCFTGSGTTGESALTYGRRFIGFDVRPGKGGVETARKRLEQVTPLLPWELAS